MAPKARYSTVTRISTVVDPVLCGVVPETVKANESGPLYPGLDW